MAAQHSTAAVPTGVPGAAPPPRHHCKDCGLFFDSARSLDVHLHYHKDNLLSKWAAAPAPADNESNNNSLQHNGHHAPKSSPVGQGAFKAVAAPADSSDGAAASPAYSSPSPFGHAPPAPSPAAQQQQQQQQRFSPAFGYAPRGTPPPPLLPMQQQQQQHFASPAFANFDLADAGPQGNFFTPPGTDNGQYILGPNSDFPVINNRNPSPAPSPYRYHPYAQPQSQQPQQQQQQQPPSQAQTPPSGTNGYDARVSSTSSQGASPAPPPPARSPQQCDKCGCLCGSSAGLAEHLRTAHPPTPFGGHPTPAAAAPTPATAPGQPLFANQDIDDFLQQHVKREAHDPDVDTNSGAANTSGDNGSSGDLLVSVKEEPAAEILDLDSHKVHQVYQEEDEQLQQQIQHHQLLWGIDPQQTVHPHPPPHLAAYAPHHVQYHTHQLAPRPAPAPFYATQHVSMDFGGAPHHLAPHPHAQQQTMFAPAAAGQRAFAPPSHMPLPHLQMAPLPPPPPPPPNGASASGNSPAPGNGSAASANSSNNPSWKSNEARRPKTYNCSACNKWFTSSGHLKRHYNTTLHKNAVKQSGAPDPATANSTSSNSSNSSSIPAPHASPGPPGPGGGSGSGGARDLSSPALSSPALSSPAALAEDSRSEDAMGFGRLTPQQQPPPPQPPPQQQQQQQQAPPPHSQPSFIPFAQHQQLQQLHLQQQQQAHHQAQQQLQQQHDFGPSVHLAQAPTHAALAQQPPYLMGASPPPTARAVPAQAAPVPAPAPFPNGLPPHVSSTPMPPATTSQLLLATSGSRSTTALPSFAHLAHGGSGIAAAAAAFGGGLALVSTSVSAAGNVGGLRSSPDDHLSRLRGGGGVGVGGGVAASRRASPDAAGASPFTALGLGDELRLPSDGGCGGADPDTEALDNNNHMATNNNYSLTTLGPAAFDTGGSSLDGSPSSGASVGSGGGLSPAPGPPPNPVRESRVSSSTPLVFKSSMISNGSIHKCLDCDKVFNKACYLTQHNKSFHAGEKPFKCKRCGKRFPEEPLYEEHCSKHAGDKPHKCAQCPKQFNHKTDLRRHLCLHTGDKPFACGVCGKGFIRKDHMLKHCETHRKKMLTAQPPLHAAPARTAAPLGV